MADEGTAFLTVADLSKRWRVSRQMIHLMKNDGRVAYYRIGKFIRFRPDDIEAYEAQVRQKAG